MDLLSESAAQRRPEQGSTCEFDSDNRLTVTSFRHSHFITSHSETRIKETKCKTTHKTAGEPTASEAVKVQLHASCESSVVEICFRAVHVGMQAGFADVLNVLVNKQEVCFAFA